MIGYQFCRKSNTRHIGRDHIKPLLEADNLMIRLKITHFLIPSFNICKQRNYYRSTDWYVTYMF